MLPDFNLPPKRPTPSLLVAAMLLLLPSTIVAFAGGASPSPAALEESLGAFADLRPDAPSPRHHQRAEIMFRLGRFEEAVADYSVAARGGKPHDGDSCWERGLAQYYAGDYQGGAAQFARYHAVGATDIENGLWHFLCLAEVEGVEKARGAMLDYTRMREAPFPALWALYRGEGAAGDVLSAAASGDTERDREVRQFYAHYYLGKYYGAVNDDDRARTHLAAALEHTLPYFMDACAREDAKRLEQTGELNGDE